MLPLLMAPGAHATDVGFLFRPEAAIDLASDRPGEDDAALRTRMRAFANGDLDDGSKWFFEIWGEHQLLSGDDVEGWWDIKPGPTGWRGKAGPWTIEAGHLIERWGKLDLLPVMDVVNPRDLSAGPLTPIEYQRLPLPMITLAIGEGDLRTATVIVPWAGADRVDSRGTDWSLVRQRMVAQYTAGMSEWPCCFDDLGDSLGTLGASLEDQDARFRRSLNIANAERELPGALFYNGEIAQRVTLDRPGFDATLTGGWMRTNQAAGTLDPAIAGILKDEILPPVTELQSVLGGASSMIENEWPRTWLAGLEASTLVGAFGVRGEARWLSDQVVRSKYLRSSTTPSVSAGVGLDWSYGTTVFLSAEARYEKMLEPPTTLLFTKRDQITVGSTARVSLLADKVRLNLIGVYDVSFQDWMTRPTITWRPSDQWEVTGGVLLIDGATDAPRGLSDMLTYVGGPGSYWSQNDAATLAVTWIR